MTGRSEHSEDPNGCKDLEVVLMNTQQARKCSFMFTPNKNIQAGEKKNRLWPTLLYEKWL